MWCFSRPDDPAAPADDEPSAAPSGGSPDTPAAAGGGSPAAAAPAAGAAPACEPGATTPCPCASAEVTSETVMNEPADRARTRLGVGERVRVTYSLGSAEWTVAGEGTLSSSSGATVTYTAPNAPGTATLTAVGSGCTKTIAFEVVAPTAVHMFKRFTSPTRVEHTQTFPDVGMFANIFLAPVDVNFHRVQFLELEIGCTASGVHACNNNSGHFPNADGLGATTHVQGSMGTFMDAFDHIYSGHCGVAWAAPQTGAMHWPIPWRWRVGGSGAWHVLTTVHQRISVEASGQLTATKAGAIVRAQAGDATTTP